jgi:hypothetical protein
MAAVVDARTVVWSWVWSWVRLVLNTEKDVLTCDKLLVRDVKEVLMIASDAFNALLTTVLPCVATSEKEVFTIEVNVFN